MGTSNVGPIYLFTFCTRTFVALLTAFVFDMIPEHRIHNNQVTYFEYSMFKTVFYYKQENNVLKIRSEVIVI